MRAELPKNNKANKRQNQISKALLAGFLSRALPTGPTASWPVVRLPGWAGKGVGLKHGAGGAEVVLT